MIRRLCAAGFANSVRPGPLARPSLLFERMLRRALLTCLLPIALLARVEGTQGVGAGGRGAFDDDVDALLF